MKTNNLLQKIWQQKDSIFKIFFSFFNLLSSLFFIIPGYFLGKRRGLNSFRKELSSAGIEQDVIEELTTEYKKTVEISQWTNFHIESKDKGQS